MFSRRLKLLKNILQHNNADWIIPWRESVQWLCHLPFAWKGKIRISRTFEKDQFKVFELDNGKYTLYWPSSMDPGLLFQVIAEILYSNHWYTYEIAENHIDLGDVVLDCGAAEGLFALVAADKHAHVYAIEPHPLFVRAMQESFRGLDLIEIVECAVGSSNGTTTISDSSIMSSIGSVGTHKVTMCTIDNMMAKRGGRVDFIKADLEGFELEMLKGAEQTLLEYKPKLAITTYHYPGDYRAISEYIDSLNLGYIQKPVGITDDHAVPVMLHAWPVR